MIDPKWVYNYPILHSHHIPTIDTILIPYLYHIDTSNVVPSSKLGSTPSPGRPLDPSRGFVLAGLATAFGGVEAPGVRDPMDNEDKPWDLI
jgi:hypothetical protein